MTLFTIPAILRDNPVPALFLFAWAVLPGIIGFVVMLP